LPVGLEAVLNLQLALVQESGYVDKDSAGQSNMYPVMVNIDRRPQEPTIVFEIAHN